MDHFRPKGCTQTWPTMPEDAFDVGGTSPVGYYLLAYDPDNYLAACSTCNARKGNHFPTAEARELNGSDQTQLAGELGALGQQQWIPAVVCAGVGLHFLPLGSVFTVPMYYLTGITLCLVAATTMIIVPLDAPAQLWQELPGFGSALILWLTSVALLLTGRRRASRG